MKSPRILERISDRCPSCTGETLFIVEAEVPPAQIPSQLILMPNHTVYATFAGCAACDWKSKAMLVPRKEIVDAISDSEKREG